MIANDSAGSVAGTVGPLPSTPSPGSQVQLWMCEGPGQVPLLLPGSCWPSVDRCPGTEQSMSCAAVL